MSKVPEVSIIMPNRCYEGYIGGPVFFPEDFIKKNERHYTGNRTHIPFLRLNAKNEVSLFVNPLGQI